jgi:hypothetical protein
VKPEIEGTMDLAGRIALKRAGRLLTTPESVKGLMKRVFDGKAPRSGCIKAFCLECVGFERAAVTESQSFACPLWKVRPFQKKGVV